MSRQEDELENICHIWQRLLGVQRVGIQDNFLRLGAILFWPCNVTHRMSQILKQHIAVADIFRHNTIASLVNNIVAMEKSIHIKQQID